MNSIRSKIYLPISVGVFLVSLPLAVIFADLNHGQESVHGSAASQMDMGDEHNAPGGHESNTMLYPVTQIGLPDSQKLHAHSDAIYPQSAFSMIMDPAGPVAPNTPTTFRFSFSLYDKAVKDFDDLHTKKLHLIIVSSDMKEFYHVHPEFQPDGSFILKDFSFTRSLTYVMYFDTSPTGSGGILFSKLLAVGSGNFIRETALPSTYPVRADGISMTVATEPANPANTGSTNLSMTFMDERTGEPIEDIEAYLGASAHVVIIPEKTFAYLHVHPVGLFSTDEKKLAKMNFGPTIKFQVSFTDEGIHRGWTQFQRAGVLHTIPFVLSVGAGTGQTRDQVAAAVHDEMKEQENIIGIKFTLLTLFIIGLVYLFYPRRPTPQALPILEVVDGTTFSGAVEGVSTPPPAASTNSPPPPSGDGASLPKV